MVITLIIVPSKTDVPTILTCAWQENTTLLQALQTAAETSSYPFLNFAVQYGTPTEAASGYNLIMLNGVWASQADTNPSNTWSVQVNGHPLASGLDHYSTQAGDVIVFTCQQ